MNAQAYKVELLSQEDSEVLLRRMRGGPENKAARRTLVMPGGFELSGEFFLTARDARSGEVEWEHSEKNLITDYGRRVWMEGHWSGAVIAFGPSTETPQSTRYSISTDALQCVDSANLTPSNAPSTHTKTFSTTYLAPGSNRTLATICFGRNGQNIALANVGLAHVTAFALLTPPKTQTTTQTLEVVYKVSMNPIA